MFVNLNPVWDAIDIVQFIEAAVDYGDWFGDNNNGYIRINLGTKPEIIENSIEKIIKEANNL